MIISILQLLINSAHKLMRIIYFYFTFFKSWSNMTMNDVYITAWRCDRCNWWCWTVYTALESEQASLLSPKTGIVMISSLKKAWTVEFQKAQLQYFTLLESLSLSKPSNYLPSFSHQSTQRVCGTPELTDCGITWAHWTAWETFRWFTFV